MNVQDIMTQARRAPPRAFGRRSALGAIKLVHSAIFLVNSAAILHIFVAGLRNRPSRWTKPALTVALAESAVFVVNHGRCPLTQVAEALGAESGRVSDIFLPRWCADRIPQLCTPPLLIGVLALVVNAWRRAARRQVSDQRPGSHTRRAVMTVEEHHSPPIVGGHPRTPWGEPQRAVAYAGRIGYS